MKRIKEKRIVLTLFLYCSLSLFGQNNPVNNEIETLDDLLGDFEETIPPHNNGENSSGGNYSGSFNSNFELGLSGDHTFDFRAPVDSDNLNFRGVIKTPKFQNEFGIDIRYKDVKLVSHWQLDLLMNETGDIAQMFTARPLENAIYWSPWKIKLGVGYQYYSWGVADQLNPTDNLNPQDYRKGAQKEKLALLSASINIYPLDWFSVQAVYVPFEQSDLFPIDFAGRLRKEVDDMRVDSSSIMTSEQAAQLILAGVPAAELSQLQSAVNNLTFMRNIKYRWNDYDYRNFLAGGKANFMTRYIDFSFSYLYDVDPYWTPEISLTKTNLAAEAGVTNPILLGALSTTGVSDFYTIDEVTLKRNRIHRFGADIKTTIDRFGLWLETCYNLTDDYDNSSYKVRNDQLKWTLGVDLNFGPNNDFYMNLQYAGGWNIGYDDQFYSDYTDGMPNMTKIGDKSYMEKFYYRAMVNKLGNQFSTLTQSVVGNWKFPVLDSLLTPQLTLAYSIPVLYDTEYDTKFGSLMISPELDIMPIDSLHIKIGANLYYAWHQLKGKDYVELDRTYDEFGIFTGDNSIYILINYKWGFDLKK